MVELERLIDLAKTGDLVGVTRMVRATPRLASCRLDTGESPVLAALYRGHHPIVAALIQLGAHLDIFAAAATGRMLELVRELTRPGAVNEYAYDGWTPLHLAAFFGHVEAVGTLLSAGADVNAVSRNTLKNTPLHAATAGKHVEAALLLLKAGADPWVCDGGGYTAKAIATENGLTPLIEAMAAARL